MISEIVNKNEVCCPISYLESLAQRPKPHDKNPGGRILAAEFEKNDCVTLVRWWCRCESCQIKTKNLRGVFPALVR